MSPQLPKAPQSREPLALEVEAQQVLDELWGEKLIPFPLNVGKITKDIGEYTIHFYDSRLHSANVSLIEGHSFRDLLRTAVLERVAKLSGSLEANRRAPN